MTDSKKSDDVIDQQPADVLDMQELLADGSARYKQLASGATYDRAAGRIVAMDNSKNSNAITKDNTQNMHNRRRALARDAVTAAIIDGTEAIDLSDGVKRLSLPLVEVVKKGGNRSVEAYNALLRAADLIDSGRLSASSDFPAGGARLEMGADAWSQVLDAIAAERRRRGGDADTGT